MKKQLLVLAITIISLHCYSQISFEKGYFINNTNQKKICLIKNLDWKNNPTEFEYKLSENSETQKATIKSIKEFGIDNISKYVRNTVNIDRSSESINKLSYKKNPIFKEEELFLKVLLEGKSNLYEYIDGDLKRYFYTAENSNIEQLIFKSYIITENNIGKNNRFKHQLWNNLKCSTIKISEVENLDYKKNELLHFFIKYNNCNNQEYVNFEEKQKRDLFNLTIRPRINNATLTIKNNVSSFRNTDFGSKIGFGLGLEAEFLLPFNNNKWAITLEPTYQYFKTTKTTNVPSVYGGFVIADVDYKSIEMPVSLRHYFFLNKNSKIFINASYILDLGLKSTIKFKRKDNADYGSLDIKTLTNLGFGIGYKHNNKYSVEMKYQTARDVLADYISWDSEYKTLSIIFGYSLF